MWGYLRIILDYEGFVGITKDSTTVLLTKMSGILNWPHTSCAFMVYADVSIFGIKTCVCLEGKPTAKAATAQACCLCVGRAGGSVLTSF